jgi:hypothetical protein
LRNVLRQTAYRNHFEVFPPSGIIEPNRRAKIQADASNSGAPDKTRTIC